MSVYKVERIVDTVRIEVDIAVAEQILEVLSLVDDRTRMAESYLGSSISALCHALYEAAEVRFPSPLYKVHALGRHGGDDGLVVLEDAL